MDSNILLESGTNELEVLEFVINGNHYGIMVEPRNVERLKAAIEYMFLNPIFKEECRVNVQHRVNERYNIDSIWSCMVALWHEVVEN